MAFLRYSVLAARILLWVVLASFVVFALATTFGLAHEREKALRAAHANAEETVGQSLPAIAIALWQYDTPGLNALINGMVQSRSVVRVEVLDRRRVVADVRQPGLSKAVDRVWTLPVMAPDGTKEIGSLRISESYAAVDAQIAGTLETLVLTELIKILGLAAVLFAIVYRKVARHLHRMADEVTHLKHSGGARQISLARKKVGAYHDELDILVDAINHFLSERNDDQKKIEFQAFHDPLTRLGNRSLLSRDLPREIEQAQRNASHVGVLCLDLDNFKNINDTLGHLLGDLMLKQLAARLEAAVAAPGWVTRHGGDEFVVVLPRIDSVEPAVELAEKLMATIAEPFHIEGHTLGVTSSIGISLCPEHGSGIGKLLSKADLAMYAAKRHGKNAYHVFEEDLLQRFTARLGMENDLRVALREGQFSLVFQPKINLSTRRVDAVEALLRWNHPGQGWVPPDAFIPVAEDIGLIIELGAWVLREALAAACRLRAELGYSVAVAVNVSPVQFRSEALMSTLRQLGEQNRDLPALIEIELTETALSGELDEIVGKLHAFRDLGLKVAIDDFGTGYSSLAYLKNFPIDILKIDQAFIRGLSNSPQDRAIVTSVVQLGKSLGFKTVAEGVEEEAHVTILSGLGCDYAQGYWFARPVPERELAEKIRTIEMT